MEKETKTDKNGYAVNEEFGTVKIANDVVAMIAGLAATEVEGVGAMAGNITNELMGFFETGFLCVVLAVLELTL